MLTAEVVDTGRTAGEVRPSRNKTGWKHDAENHKAGRGGVHAARAAVIARLRLPAGQNLPTMPSTMGGCAAQMGNVSLGNIADRSIVPPCFRNCPLETRMVEETECSGS